MSTQPSSTHRRAFVFAGGGTGGHIYPALAIIEELRAINPDVQVHILCSNRVIDTQILYTHDVPFTPIPARPMSKKPAGLIRFMTSWVPSVRATRRCIQGLKAHHDSVVLVAMGGFVAAPGARGGHIEKSRVVLINLDAVPGKANRLIAKGANQIFTAAKIRMDDPRLNDWEQVRPVVRGQASQSIEGGAARQSFGLAPSTKTLLITGGSQGATSINAFVRTLVQQHPQAFESWQIIHQVGSTMPDEQLEALRSVYREAGINAFVERYIDDMSPALAAADLAIGRCGAGSVAECWGARVPVIFFPYPYHADEHQKHNAQVLVDAGVAIVCGDHVDAEANMQAHAHQLVGLLISDDQLDAMHARYQSLADPDGARVIAQGLME